MKRTARMHSQAMSTEGSPSHVEINSARRPMRRALVAMGFLVAAALSSTLAFGDDRKPDVPPLNFAGDETIGTLPILQGPDVVELRRDLVIHEPSLCLEGDLATIQNSIVFSRGDVAATVVSADLRTGRVCVVFPGNVQIGFDKLMIESSDIRVGLWMPGRGTSNLEAGWGDRRSMVGVGTAFSELPILGMSATGALSYSPLWLMAHGTSAWTRLVATTTQDFLILRQSH